MVLQCQTMSFFLERKSRTSATARPQTVQEVSFVVVKIKLRDVCYDVVFLFMIFDGC